MSRIRYDIAILLVILMTGCFGSSTESATEVAADDPLPGAQGEPASRDAEPISEPVGKSISDSVAEPLTNEMKQALADPAEEHRELYLQLSKNADVKVRLAVLKALEDIEQDEASIDAIIALTSDREASVRRRAVESIWYFGLATPDALDALERLVTDSDPGVRKEAIQTVGELEMEDGGKRMVPALMKVIAAKNQSTSAAIESLKRIGPPPESAPLLKDAFEEHGEAALFAMARIKTPQTDMLPWLRKIMTSDDDDDRRLAAAWTLGRFDDTELLIAAVGSSDAARRAVGIEGLGGVRNPSAEVIDLLIAALNDEDPAIRERAADAIRYAESPTAAIQVALMRAFADPEFNVRDMARASLEQLIDEERLDPQVALTNVEAALAESPKDKGLILAKAALIFPIAYDLTAYEQEHAKALDLFNSASAGLLKEVLPSDYQLSGDEKKAISTLFYDAACAASGAGKPDLGVKYLREAFENGWRDIGWAKDDSDLDPLRERDDYKELMKKYDP